MATKTLYTNYTHCSLVFVARELFISILVLLVFAYRVVSNCNTNSLFTYMQRSLNKLGEILPKKLAVGSTVNSCTFFKEINSDGSFYVPKDYQHDLLYWLLCLELFLYRRVSVFPFHGLPFSLILIYWLILVYIIGPFSIKKFPLIYWMTLVYIIGPSSVKKFPLIYWITLVQGGMIKLSP